jgi:hypothetical protein
MTKAAVGITGRAPASTVSGGFENARQKAINSLWGKPSAGPRVGEIGAIPVGRPWSAFTKVPAENRV